MTRAASMNRQALQELVDRGYQPCSICHGLALPDRATCQLCEAPLGVGGLVSSHPAAGPAAAVKRPRKASAPRRTGTRRGDLGSLADWPGGVLRLQVLGLPASEGSTRAVAPGVVLHDDPELKTWRAGITTAAERVCGPDWRPANAAVRVGVVVTVPRPSGARKHAIPADGFKDLDKLLRAVDDALSPSGPIAFRVLESDMRIVGYDAVEKTHPRPLHTHPAALPEPGAVITVRDGRGTFTSVDIDGQAHAWVPLLDAPTPTDPA